MDIEMRSITHGRKFHWFGYYDKWQFDLSGRYVLGMEVDFAQRSPTADDEIGLGLIDLEDGDRWSELGRTRAWGWQQGCMPNTTSITYCLAPTECALFFYIAGALTRVASTRAC
jgi:hypothetical protein